MKTKKELQQYARYLRQHMTLSEVLLWKQLNKNQFNNLNFNRQQVIEPFIVDFYCPQVKLIIEIDGSTHLFSGEYDINRDNYLSDKGFYIIHFQDIDIKQNLNSVLVKLEEIVMSLQDGKISDREPKIWHF